MIDPKLCYECELPLDNGEPLTEAGGCHLLCWEVAEADAEYYESPGALSGGE